ncbi:uncharacterized protein LOC119995712 [Tripterygium wilfordii]|nr:uncharacterized protein LOC119995712 [Tripterygium wilfordii]
MEAQKADQIEMQAIVASQNPAIKKRDNVTFLKDVKDHCEEFIHASMDERKSCFKQSIQKMFGTSKVSAEEIESSLHRWTVIADF